MPTAGELGVDSVQDVVAISYGLPYEEHGDELLLHCPNPAHPDAHPSCGVNKITGLWHCFSCGVGGDLIRLGMYVTDMSPDALRDLLTPSTPDAIITQVQRRLAQLKINTIPPRPSEMRLPGPYRDGPLDELLDRGFKEETLHRWGVRFCASQELQGKKGLFTIKNSIAIPVRDRQNNLLCWLYRATKASPPWQPRYLPTPGVELATFWFGHQHHANTDHVVVVEGAIDAMWLDQCGFPAVAIMGNNLPDRKVLLLQQHKSITLMGDRDAGGAQMVSRLGNLLGNRISVKVARYSRWMPGGDPQEMHPVDVELMVDKATPWTKYRLLLASQ